MEANEFVKKANEIIAILNGMNYEDGAKLLLYVLAKVITNGCEGDDYGEVIDDVSGMLYLLVTAESKKGGEK